MFALVPISGVSYRERDLILISTAADLSHVTVKSEQIARSPFLLFIRGHSRHFMQPTTEMTGCVATRPTVVPATVAGQ